MTDLYANPVINYDGSVPGAQQGSIANRPAAGYNVGAWYLALDQQKLYEWNGSAWVVALDGSGGGGSQNLQQVTNVGNVTTNDIIVQDPGVTIARMDVTGSLARIVASNIGTSTGISIVADNAGNPYVLYTLGVHQFKLESDLFLTNGTWTIQPRSGKMAFTDRKLNAQGGNYQVVLTDQYSVIVMANAAPCTITIPTNLTVNFPEGIEIWIAYVSGVGGSTVSVLGAAGVTINAAGGSNDIGTQYQMTKVLYYGNDTWLFYISS